MPRPLVALLALAALPAPAEAAASGGARWHPPLADGVVVGRFAYDREAPFARGGRRGVDLAAPAGATVRAACGGVVTHAGRVPGRGLGVTLACPGALVATHLGLTRVTVRRGAVLAPAARIGRLGAAGRLRLGARRAGDRFGYVDPLRLLAAARPSLPLLGPAPRGRRRLPRGAPPVRRVHRPRPPAPPAGPPALVWAGLALVAAGATAAVGPHPRGRGRAAAAGSGGALGIARARGRTTRR